MNICVLSDQKQNLFCCYKIAKITNNTFNISNPCQQFEIKIKEEYHFVNFWTQYNGLQNNCYILILKEEDSQIFLNKMLDVIKKINNIDPNYKCILLVNLFDNETKHLVDTRSKESIKLKMDNLSFKFSEQYEKKISEKSPDIMINKYDKIPSNSDDDDGFCIVQSLSYLTKEEYITREKVKYIKEERNKFIEPYVFASSHNIHSIAANLYNDEHVIKIIDLVVDMIYNR